MYNVNAPHHTSVVSLSKLVCRIYRSISDLHAAAGGIDYPNSINSCPNLFSNDGVLLSVTVTAHSSGCASSIISDLDFDIHVTSVTSSAPSTISPSNSSIQTQPHDSLETSSTTPTTTTSKPDSALLDENLEDPDESAAFSSNEEEPETFRYIDYIFVVMALITVGLIARYNSSSKHTHGESEQHILDNLESVTSTQTRVQQ